MTPGSQPENPLGSFTFSTDIGMSGSEPASAPQATANPDNFVIPTVIERTAEGRQSLDILSSLLQQGTVMIHEPIDNRTAGLTCAQLKWLEHHRGEKPVELHLNSPGGSVTAGLAIYDVMQNIKPDVSVIVMGSADSMGAVLASGGAKGKRFALPNARIMIHSIRGGTQGIHQDMKNQVEEMTRLNERLAEILSENTGQPLDRVKQDMVSDHFMDAKAALEYGIIDGIINPDGSLTKREGE
jgi:ATP-dependent Clp protease protease subunit